MTRCCGRRDDVSETRRIILIVAYKHDTCKVGKGVGSCSAARKRHVRLLPHPPSTATSALATVAVHSLSCASNGVSKFAPKNAPCRVSNLVWASRPHLYHTQELLMVSIVSGAYCSAVPIEERKGKRTIPSTVVASQPTSNPHQFQKHPDLLTSLLVSISHA